MSEEKNIERSGKEQGTSNKPEAKQPATSNQQQQTSNLKPETTNMETHAHHLHKAPGKKWTHYLFEFLMLFLAVFCGFLAENFREHQVEKERGRQYILSLYEDLKADTTRLGLLII